MWSILQTSRRNPATPLRTRNNEMTILGASIGIFLGLLFGLRKFRLASILTGLVALSLLLFFADAAIEGMRQSHAVHTTKDAALSGIGFILFVLLYGGGYFWYYIMLPGGVTFALVSLIRYFRAPPPPRFRQFFHKLKFALLGAVTFGCIYLLYAIWLLTIARSLGGGVFENADFNSPILWLVEMFGPDQMIGMPDSSPLLLGVIFAIVGTVCYALFGAMIGFVVDLHIWLG